MKLNFNAKKGKAEFKGDLEIEYSVEELVEMGKQSKMVLEWLGDFKSLIKTLEEIEEDRNDRRLKRRLEKDKDIED